MVGLGSAEARSIVVLGDSLSAGYGLEAGSGWVDLLAKRLGEDWRVHNASISGATSANALGYVEQSLVPTTEVMILALGGNDALRGFSLATVEQNLATLIRTAQSQGAQVLLVGIDVPLNYGGRYRQALAALYQRLAEDYQTPLLPFLLEGFATDPSYFQSDGIHPNESAQELILANVWELLEPML